MLNNQSNFLPARLSTRPCPGANTSTPFSRAHSATESLAVTTHSMCCPRASRNVPHSMSNEPSPISAQPNFATAGEALILNILNATSAAPQDWYHKPWRPGPGGTKKRALVGAQADEIFTIVNALYGLV